MEAIVLNKLDPNFKYEIAAQPGGEGFKLCFSCGTCTATCPVAEIDEDYNPRRIIRQALLGMRQQVLSSRSIWLCAQCFACSVRCPQGVNFRDIIGVLRQMAVKEGYAPPETVKDIKQIDTLSQRIRHELIRYYFEEREKFEQLKGMVEEELEITPEEVEK
jgi:heterodisulfide reductase subunit C